MCLRDLVTVGLRALGIWILLTLVQSLSLSVYYLLQVTGGSRSAVSGVGGAGDWFALLIGGGLFPLGGAVGLLWLAPRISRWVCRDVSGDSKLLLERVGPGDAYRIACLVLGVLALIWSVKPLVTALVIILLASSGVPTNGIVSLLSGAVMAILSLFLIFGSSGISGMLARLSYDHDRVADQRFSLRAWLILITLLAVLLLAARLLTR